MNPLVSVIVPSYNHANFIQYCLKSLILQTYENIELIIIDDGSIDESLTKIKEMEDILKSRFVKYTFIPQENKGICVTANKGIKLSEGKYYQFVSSDDFILEQYIEKQVEFLEENKEFACSYTDGLEIQSEDLDMECYTNSPSFSTNIEYLSGNLRKFMLNNVFNVPSPAFMYRKELIEKIGFYDEKLNFEDIDMFLRISRVFKIGCVKEILYLHRIHGNNTGRNLEILEKGLKKMIQKYSMDNIYSESEKELLVGYFNSYYSKFREQIDSNHFLTSKKYRQYLNGRKLVFWGTGSFAKNILNKSDLKDIKFFIDSSGKIDNFEGYKVYKPERLENCRNSYYVYIASSFKSEIREILERYGYTYIEDFY